MNIDMDVDRGVLYTAYAKAYLRWAKVQADIAKDAKNNIYNIIRIKARKESWAEYVAARDAYEEACRTPVC